MNTVYYATLIYACSPTTKSRLSGTPDPLPVEPLIGSSRHMVGVQGQAPVIHTTGTAGNRYAGPFRDDETAHSGMGLPGRKTGLMPKSVWLCIVV